MSSDIDPTRFSEHPVSNGGFSDIYRGQLPNGALVALKSLRISVNNLIQDPKHLKVSWANDVLSLL